MMTRIKKEMLKVFDKICYKSIFCYITIFFVILCSGYLLLYSNPQTLYRTIIFLIFFIVLTCALIYLIFKKKIIVLDIIKKTLLPFFFVIIMIFGCLCSFFINKEFSNFAYYGLTCLLFVIAYELILIFDFHFFMRRFINMIFFLCILGISFFAFSFFSKGFSFSPLPSVTFGKVTYSNFIFLFVSSGGRLQGPFWEPGLFSSIVLITWTIDIILSKKISFVRYLAYFIAILLTQSTFAYIAVFLVLFLIVNKFIKNKNVKIFINISSILCFFLCLIFYNQIISILANIFPSIFNKISGGVESRISFTTRIYSPYANLLVFIKKPFFGCGLYGADVAYAELIATKFKGVIDSQTSTTFRWIAQIGIIGIVYSVFPIFCFIKNKRMDLISSIVLSILFIFILNKEPHNQILITILIPMFFSKTCFFQNEFCMINADEEFADKYASI